MGRKNIKFFRHSPFLNNKKGLTLVELIIVIAIVLVLILVLIVTLNPRLQINKSHDSRRKADLKRISTALEEYIDDKACYPDSIYTGLLSSYIDPVPKDPQTSSEYAYEKVSCDKYVLYTTLVNIQGGLIYGNGVNSGNYVVSSPNLNLEPTGEAGNFSLISPEQTNIYGCLNGVCTLIRSWVQTDKGVNCQPVYGNSHCDNGMCSDPMNNYNCPWQFDPPPASPF